MSLIKNLPRQWGRKRFLIGKGSDGHTGGLIGTAIVMTDRELEELVKAGAEELGWKITRGFEEKHERGKHERGEKH